jgi:hypothetical protein
MIAVGDLRLVLRRDDLGLVGAPGAGRFVIPEL